MGHFIMCKHKTGSGEWYESVISKQFIHHTIPSVSLVLNALA